MENINLGNIGFGFSFTTDPANQSNVTQIINNLDKVYDHAISASSSFIGMGDSAVESSQKVKTASTDVVGFVAKIKEKLNQQKRENAKGSLFIEPTAFSQTISDFSKFENSLDISFKRALRLAKKYKTDFSATMTGIPNLISASANQAIRGNVLTAFAFMKNSELGQFRNKFSLFNPAETKLALAQILGDFKSNFIPKLSQGFLSLKKPVTDLFAHIKDTFGGKGLRPIYQGMSNIARSLFSSAGGGGAGGAGGGIGGQFLGSVFSNFGGARGISGLFGGGAMSLGTLGATTGVVAGIIATVAALNKAQNESRKFADEWANVTTVLESGKKSTEGLRQSVLELSKNYGVSAAETAKAYYLVVSSGIKDQNEALMITDVASRAAIAGLTRTTVAVDALTTVLNAYELKAKDAERVSDMMFTTVLEGKATYEELARSIGIALPFFAQANIKLEDFFSSVATLSQGGLRTNIIMTALRGVIAQIVKPADSALKVSKALGIEFTTEAIAAKGLVGWLKELAEKTKLNTQTIAALFPDVRGLTAVLALVNKQSETNARINAVMATRTGVTDEAFKKQTATLNRQWQIMYNRLTPAFVAFGDFLTGGLKWSLTEINKLFETNTIKIRNSISALHDQKILLGVLLPEYDSLKAKTSLNAKEQDDLKLVIESIIKILPEAASKFDEYGNALDINRDRVENYARNLSTMNKTMLEGLEVTSKYNIEKLKADLKDAEDAVNKTAEKISKQTPLSSIKNPDLRQEASDNLSAMNDAYLKQLDTLDKLKAKLKENVDNLSQIQNMLYFGSTTMPVSGMQETIDNLNNSTKQEKSDIQKLEEFATKHYNVITQIKLNAFNEYLKKQKDANGLQIKDLADLNVMLGTAGNENAKAYWNEFNAESKKEAKKTAAELKQEREQILSNFLKNVDFGDNSSIETLGAGQVSRLADIIQKSKPELFKLITDASMEFDKQVAEKAAAELTEWLKTHPIGSAFNSQQNEKEIQRQVNLARNYFEEILGTPIDTDIFRHMWDNYDETLMQITHTTKDAFVKGVLDSWANAKSEIERSGIIARLLLGIKLGPEDSPEHKRFAEIQKSIGNIAYLFFKDPNGLNPAIEAVQQNVERLIGSLKSASPLLGGFISDFIGKFQALANDTSKSFNFKDFAGKSMTFAATNLAFGVAENVVSGLIKSLSGGKTILDMVEQQIQTRESINALKEELKGKPNNTLQEALAAALKVQSKEQQLFVGSINGKDLYKQVVGKNDMAYLIDLFNKLGISIPDWAKKEGDDFARWLNGFIATTRDALKSFGAIDSNSLPGIVDNFQHLVDIMGIEDVTKKWEYFIDLLTHSTDASSKKLGTLFKELKDPKKISDAASLFRQFIAAGGIGGATVDPKLIAALEQVFGVPIQDLIDIIKGSGLTQDQIDALLASIQGMGNDLQQGINDKLDRTAVTRNVSITEQQGWTIISLLNSMHDIAKNLENAVISLLNFLQGQVSNTTTDYTRLQPLGNTAGSGINITINSLVINANSESQGAAAARGFMSTVRDTEQRVRSVGIKTIGQRAR